MKPDYKNWIPKGMLYSLIAGTLLSLVLLLILGVFLDVQKPDEKGPDREIQQGICHQHHEKEQKGLS